MYIHCQCCFGISSLVSCCECLTVYVTVMYLSGDIVNIRAAPKFSFICSADRIPVRPFCQVLFIFVLFCLAVAKALFTVPTPPGNFFVIFPSCPLSFHMYHQALVSVSSHLWLMYICWIFLCNCVRLPVVLLRLHFGSFVCRRLWLCKPGFFKPSKIPRSQQWCWKKSWNVVGLKEWEIVYNVWNGLHTVLSEKFTSVTFQRSDLWEIHREEVHLEV